jgi:tRNA dimethylallyltransferase
MNKKSVIILGPTATHKTKMSIFLSGKFPFEIISADSMQFYAGMNVGTDKIPEEKRIVKHHLLDVITVSEEFSVAEFKRLAEKAMQSIFAGGHYPLIVGGSGLYIRALTEGFPVEESAPPDKNLREELSTLPLEGLRKKAMAVDRISYKKVGANDRKRLVRIIEFYKITGRKLSETKNRKSDIEFLKIGLIKERRVLYADIEKRVEEMFKSGLVEEIKLLQETYPNWSKTALQAIGYKEVLSYLNNEITIDEAKEEIKKRTRHLAKKQITWFKKEKNVIWINSEDFELAKEKAFYIVKNFLESDGGAEGI